MLCVLPVLNFQQYNGKTTNNYSPLHPLIAQPMSFLCNAGKGMAWNPFSRYIKVGSHPGCGPKRYKIQERSTPVVLQFMGYRVKEVRQTHQNTKSIQV